MLAALIGGGLGRRPLGCASGVALVAGLLILLATAASAVITSNEVFSPGELRSEVAAVPLGGVYSHAELECSGCHTPPWSLQRMGDKCLDCHMEVRAELSESGSLHGDGFATRLNCRKCHTEHDGPSASLTTFDVNDIQHDRFGFSLRAHEVEIQIACVDCHTESLRIFDVAPCVVCHLEVDEDYTLDHVDDFGFGCLACHDGIESYGSSFDHQLVMFPLEGKHWELTCDACHAGATTIDALKEAPQECAACHLQDDVHEGRLGVDCGDCHEAAAWDIVLTFDHALTRFALEGMHAEALCEQCHISGQLTGIPRECVDCHVSDDVHQGRLGSLCEQCHHPVAWDQVDLVVFDHGRTGFRLSGAHERIPCSACHGSNLLADLPRNCVGCHGEDDPHDGRLGSACQECHGTTTWDEVDLGAFDHALTGFRLTGEHQAISCQSCHLGGLLSGLPRDCIGCHSSDDVHRGQLSVACADCHVTSAWNDLSLFDHSQTTFPLTGAHTSVSCDFCHLGNDFHDAPTTCFACHGEPPVHRGLLGTACANCHTTQGWVPANFGLPHDFPLDHGGAEANCSYCHTATMHEYTCFVCHDQIDTVEFHTSIGINDLSSCTSCHPTGER